MSLKRRIRFSLRLTFFFVYFFVNITNDGCTGVAGGTASGKSTVCKRIIEKLGQADINERQRQVSYKKSSFLAILSTL